MKNRRARTPAIGPSDWIILDTSIIRGLVQGESESINLVKELRTLRGQHYISLADGAPVEILYWLERAPDETIKRVKPALGELSRILDPEFPIAPGPLDLAEFTGLIRYSPGKSRSDLKRFSKALWKHLRTIASREDLKRDLRYRNSSDQEVIKRYKGTEGVLRPLQDTWIDSLIAADAKRVGYEGLAEEHAERITQRNQKRLAELIHLPPSNGVRARLELLNQYMVERVRMVSAKGYSPPKKTSSNPAVDAILLFYMVLPAIVCTADSRFVNSVRSLKPPDRLRVMLPAELLAWLREGILPS